MDNLNKKDFFKKSFKLFGTLYFKEEYINMIPKKEMENIISILDTFKGFYYDEKSYSLKSVEGDNSIEIVNEPIKFDFANRSHFVIKIKHKDIEFWYNTEDFEDYVTHKKNLTKKDFYDYLFKIESLLNDLRNHLDNKMYDFFEIV